MFLRGASSKRMLRNAAFLAAAAASLSLAQDSLPVKKSPPASRAYQPITAKQRWGWFTTETIGPQSIAGGVVSAGWGTLFNKPSEYGTHWDGFGKRYGMRLTGISTGNAMEAGLGAIWGEDPRYSRASGESFGVRIGHVVKMTFLAQNREGRLMPAYARYIGISGNNLLSNAWRADSEAEVSNAAVRIALGFLGRMSSNAFREFWPDVRQRLSRKDPAAPARQTP